MNACNKVTFSQMIQVLLLKRQRKEMCLYLLSFALYPSTFSISQRTPSVVHRDPGTSLSALCLSNHPTIMCPYTSLQPRLSVLDFDLQLWRKSNKIWNRKPGVWAQAWAQAWATQHCVWAITSQNKIWNRKPGVWGYTYTTQLAMSNHCVSCNR